MHVIWPLLPLLTPTKTQSPFRSGTVTSFESKIHLLRATASSEAQSMSQKILESIEGVADEDIDLSELRIVKGPFGGHGGGGGIYASIYPLSSLRLMAEVPVPSLESRSSPGENVSLVSLWI